MLTMMRHPTRNPAQHREQYTPEMQADFKTTGFYKVVRI